MKIDPNLQPTGDVQSDAVQSSKGNRTQQANSDSAITQTDGHDTVQVSPRFVEVQQLTAKLQNVPEIRSDRVASLKAQIQKGAYKPDPSEVADAMLGDPLSQGGRS